MRTVESMRMLALLLVFNGVVVFSGHADEVSVESKMNQEIKVDLKDVMITEALAKISKEIDVPIRISDEAEWKLPYGKATRLSVTLKGPASEALMQMLNEFFMRYAVGQDEIVIYPRPELDHIIGRPSARQLNVLKAIYTKPIEVYITNQAVTSINAALGMELFISPIDVHSELDSVLRKLSGEKKVQYGTSNNRPLYRTELPKDENEKEFKEYTLMTPVTLPQLLRDVQSGSSPVEWYIPSLDLANQVPEVRVALGGTLSMLNRQQLIDVSFEDKSLLEIFQTLADHGNIYYRKESRVVPDLEERVTVSMQNVTAIQAMKKIADMAKFSYDADDRGEFILLEKIQPPKPQVRPAATRTTATSKSTDSSQYVGKISIPMEGGQYYIEYMLCESDLTDELKKLRSEKIAEILGKPVEPSEAPKQAVPEN